MKKGRLMLFYLRIEKVILYVFIIVCCGKNSFAGNNQLIFEKNFHQYPQQVLFSSDVPGAKVFFEKNALTFLAIEHLDFHHLYKTNSPVTVKMHAWKLSFEGASRESAMEGDEPYSYYRNYYRGNEPGNWSEKVNLYKKLYHKNIYQGIDVKYYNTETNFKYDFIIHPHANFSQIRLKYEGIDQLRLSGKKLVLTTSLGDFMEEIPIAYQIINGKQVKVECEYVLNASNSTVSFQPGENYNPNYALIIDPQLVASTYTGSTADNWGFTSTYDAKGNIYTGGIVFGVGYPTSNGAFQTTFGGGTGGIGTLIFDISLTKYNPTGTAILFSTYYGGDKNDQPHSLIVNDAEELYVAGRSFSANFPTRAGSYDVSHNGGSDIIVGKISSTGALLASTFVGGSGDDGVNYNADETILGVTKFNYADDGRSEIIFDNSGNVYVAGSTKSSNFPLSSGAYDNTLNGQQDACVIKLDPNLSALLFSTYLGGSDYDAAYGIKVRNNKVFVTGGTNSNNFPTTSGVINPVYKGNIDGFISVFNDNGTSLLNSTFLGTDKYDQGYFVEIDYNGDVYILGQTMGAYPVVGNVYKNANSAQFIHKLNQALSSTIFSTVIGTGASKPNISPTAFLVDDCKRIFIAGWARCAALEMAATGNTITGMPITANAYQATTDGCDFYFMILKPDASDLSYATFFGENGITPDHVDGGTSRFDPRGFVYQSACASCGGSSGFPTSSGAWSLQNKSMNCNNAVVKFDMGASVVAVSTTADNKFGCAPLKIKFDGNGSNGKHYIWDFGDGNTVKDDFTPTHEFLNPGVYKVKLLVVDTLGTCILKDSSLITVTVTAPPQLQISTLDIGCVNVTGSATVWISAGTKPFTIEWSTTPPSANTTISGLSTGTYSVTVKDSAGCTAKATATIIKAPTMSINWKDVKMILCNGAHNGSLSSGITGGSAPFQFNWNQGAITGDSLLSNLGPGSYEVIVTDKNGCKDTLKADITEPPLLDASISDTVHIKCFGGKEGKATVNITGGVAPYTISWNTSPVQNTLTATQLAAGNFEVTVVDKNLCKVIRKVSIVQPTKLQVLAQTEPTLCGESTGAIKLTVSGAIPPYSYNWLSPLQANTPTVSNLSEGQYSCIVKDARDCKDSLGFMINSIQAVKADFTFTPEVAEEFEPDVTFTNLSTGNAHKWKWDFGDLASGTANFSGTKDPKHQYSGPGVFCVKLIASSATDKCPDTITKCLTVIPQTSLYVPNAFTPNNDGVNDSFSGYGINISTYSMRIYNRWGELVYESNDLKKGWNGRHHGLESNEVAPEDVYIWRIEAVFTTNQKVKYTGRVSLVK